MAREDSELRKAGLKVTVPRVKILQILEQNTELHLSAEDVYRAWDARLGRWTEDRHALPLRSGAHNRATESSP